MKKSFVKGALLLTVCALIGKVIGAFYRIPFAMIVGAEGVGLYQLVYPLYVLILTISTSGIPSSISKLLSQSYAAGRYFEAKKYFKYSFLIIIVLSTIGFLSILLLSKPISKLQGNINAVWCYVAISPAVLFAGVVAAFRGYFQSKENMLPSAISGLIEQICKVAIGLLLAFVFRSSGVVIATVGALVGVSVSELVSCLYMLLSFRATEKKVPQVLLVTNDVPSGKQIVKNILKISIPIAIGGLIMPITMIIDSTLIVRILSQTNSIESSTKLFGLQSGVVGSLANLPIVASIAAQAVILPRITREKTQNNSVDVTKTIKNALFFVLIIAIPCAICYVIFAKQIVMILYSHSFSGEQIEVCSKLLMLSSANIIALSIAQTTAGILQGLGKVKTPAITLAIGAVIKIIGVVLLVSQPNIGIYGAEISDIICYGVVSGINVAIIHKNASYNFVFDLLQVLSVSAVVFVVSFFSNYCLLKLVSPALSFAIAGIITAILYLLCLVPIVKKQTGKSVFQLIKGR